MQKALRTLALLAALTTGAATLAHAAASCCTDKCAACCKDKCCSGCKDGKCCPKCK